MSAFLTCWSVIQKKLSETNGGNLNWSYNLTKFYSHKYRALTVPIEDLGEESEVEDSEIEEGLAIEIAAMDPAPAYTE